MHIHFAILYMTCTIQSDYKMTKSRTRRDAINLNDHLCTYLHPYSALTTMDPEQLFHASQIELLIPSYSSCPAQPEDPSSSSWWTDAQNARTRDTAYLGTSLSLLQ
jgi:hypothetical protein